jgi:hypothetical protein
MLYNFTQEQLHKIQDVMEFSGEFGPRAAFRYFHKLKEDTTIPTDDVEDFAIAFMSQYNRQIRNVY